MVVSRVHAKLFAAVARDLDWQVRRQFHDETLRPDYLKDFLGDLDALTRHAEVELEASGRLLWAKRLFNRLLRPFWSRQVRQTQMLAERLRELHEGYQQLCAAADGVRDQVHEEVHRRVDELRADLRAEARHHGAAPAAAPAAAPGRCVPAGSALVLGPVAVRRRGYEHLDLDDADFGDLPARPGSLREILVANALEYFTAAELRSRLLPHWAALLQPGGRLVLVADDVAALVDRVRDGLADADEVVGVLFGDGGAGGRARRSAFTPQALQRLAHDAGLERAEVTDRRQDGEGAYGFELVAYRPAGEVAAAA